MDLLLSLDLPFQGFQMLLKEEVPPAQRLNGFRRESCNRFWVPWVNVTHLW